MQTTNNYPVLPPNKSHRDERVKRGFYICGCGTFWFILVLVGLTLAGQAYFWRSTTCYTTRTHDGARKRCQITYMAGPRNVSIDSDTCSYGEQDCWYMRTNVQQQTYTHPITEQSAGLVIVVGLFILGSIVACSFYLYHRYRWHSSGPDRLHLGWETEDWEALGQGAGAMAIGALNAGSMEPMDAPLGSTKNKMPPESRIANALERARDHNA